MSIPIVKKVPLLSRLTLVYSSAGQPAQKTPTTTATSAAPLVFVATAVHAFR